MKINLIIGSFYPAVSYGGPVFSTLYTSRELARLGHQVYVSTTNANSDTWLDVETNKFIPFEENIFVKYYFGYGRSGFSLRLLLSIRNDIRESDVLFVNSVFSYYVPVALFFARLQHKQVLLSPRGSFGTWCMNARKSLIKKLWLSLMISPFTEGIIWHATSNQEKDEITSIYPRSRVEVIPNGINLAEFKTHEDLSRSEFMARYAKVTYNPTHIIISMGRLHVKKGFDILIDSFYAIHNEFPHAVLMIAGPDGGAGSALRSKICSIGLDKRIFLIGGIQGKDKIDFLANADLFVLPSHNENFGNVYAESLASGTPVIASTNTPWEEVVRYNCGKWVPNTVEETSFAIRKMLTLDLYEMGLCGKKYIFEHFSWSAVALKFESVFKRLQ